MALSRDRLDLERGTMRIDRQDVELADNSLVLDTPKTAAEIRTVHIPPHCCRTCERTSRTTATTRRWC